MLIHGEVGEIFTHFAFAHVRRMAVLVEEALLDPSDMSFFGPDAVVLAADGLLDLIEEFRLIHDMTCFRRRIKLRLL